MNRKSQLLGALTGIVLFLIVLLAAINFAKGIFKLSQQSSDDFNTLNSLIDDVSKADVGSIESMPLRIDKGAAIVFFENKGKPIVITCGYFFRSEIYGATKKTESKEIAVPTNCESGKTCVCLCKKLELTKDKATNKEYYLCQNILCKSNEFDIKYKSSTPLQCTATEGGSIIERDALKDVKAPRERTIYVEKTSEKLITICDALEQGKCVQKESEIKYV